MESTLDKIDKKKPLWFVMHVYKREKEAEDKLTEAEGINFYIPKHYKIQTYHEKKIKRLVPYIPGIIFVQATYERIIAFKQQYNLLQFTTWKKSTGTEYLIVSDRQMEHFIKVSTRYEENPVYFKPDELNLKKGTRIRVIGGMLDGVEGLFVKVNGRRNRQVVVVIPDIMAVAVEVKPDLIEILPQTKENNPKEKKK